MEEFREPSRWRRPQRWVPLALVGFILLGVIGLRVGAKAGANRELEKIRKQGLPTTAAELDIWYKRVPVEENAALLFSEASMRYVTPVSTNNPDDTSFGKLVPGIKIRPSQARALNVFAEANEPTVEKMLEAAELPKSRFPINLANGAETLLPHLAPMKRLAQVTKWVSIQRAIEGKNDESVAILKAGFAAAASLENEPILISELVRIAMIAILIQGLERAVVETDFTGAQLAALYDTVEARLAQSTNGMMRAFIGERAFGYSAMDLSYQKFVQFSSWGNAQPDFSSPGELAKATLFGLRRSLGMHERDKAFYLKTMGEWTRIAESNGPDMLEESDRAYEATMEEIKKHPIRHLFSGLLLPAMGKAVQKQAQVVARLRCAQTALAIERYRARNSGKLPSVADLVPEYLLELPRDPADHKPLEYRMEENGDYKIIAVKSTELLNFGRSTKADPLEVSFRVARNLVSAPEKEK